MATKVWGCSDDLIEFDGDVGREVACCGTDDREHGVLLVCSDGTILEVKYGKGGAAIWGIVVIKHGTLLDGVEPCNDEDADPYSDVAQFADGLRWVYAVKDWERVS